MIFSFVIKVFRSIWKGIREKDFCIRLYYVIGGDISFYYLVLGWMSNMVVRFWFEFYFVVYLFILFFMKY